MCGISVFIKEMVFVVVAVGIYHIISYFSTDFFVGANKLEETALLNNTVMMVLLIWLIVLSVVTLIVLLVICCACCSGGNDSVNGKDSRYGSVYGGAYSFPSLALQQEREFPMREYPE